ncbi:YqgQ family protein [Alkalicoccus daliensis]|uniref:DUF910 family protein n=1 Tax=Alkalicoccus daliensis TaxID=745820 RepID=A0A1H0B7W6_9BACI|nr:YqgQ family protein [Alkalicoccus daliensis]SDN41716.1 protein of unknown function [Alkalicoccus daliensis]
MTYLELLQHLRVYHVFVYTGDKEADLDLITEEIKEQYQLGIVDKFFLHQALTAVAAERSKLKKQS